MANQILMTLHELLLKLFTDPSYQAEHDDIEALLVEHGHGDVSPGELKQAMALVADDLPPVQAQQLSSYLQANSGATGTSTFNINQGGGAAGTSTAATGGMNAPASGGSGGATGSGGGTGGGAGGSGGATGGGGGAGGGAGAGGGGGAAAGVAATPPPPPPVIANEPPLETVVREINHITNNVTNITETNTTNIDDRDTITDNSVRQSINAGGDVDLDQEITNNTASGDGAVAGAEGSVNTGENSGIVGDASGARVTNLEGDGNTVISDVGEDANVVTGEVGQFVGGDVSESNLIGGDNQGVAITDANVEGVTVGDGNTAVGDVGGNANLGGSQVNVQDSEAVNLGDGEQNLNVAGGNVNTGSGDVIQAQGAAVNTGTHGEAANANLGGFGQGASDDGGASIAQVNVGSGSAEAAIDQSTDIDQQATINQTQDITVDGGHGGDGLGDGLQEVGLDLDAGGDEPSMTTESIQSGTATHEAVELPEETMAE